MRLLTVAGFLGPGKTTIDVEGTTPNGCAALTFTLNVLVFGLSYSRVSSLVLLAAAQAATRWAGTVTVHAAHTPERQSHHH